MYVTRKCSSCGHWAVFEFAISGGRASETCTHCRAAKRDLPWDRDARMAHAAYQAEFERLCEKHPELRELRRPGDHLKLAEE